MVTDVRPVGSRSRARPMRISRAGSTALVLVQHEEVGVGELGPPEGDQLPLPADIDSPRWPTRVSDPVGSPASQSPRPMSSAAARSPRRSRRGARSGRWRRPCRRRGSPPGDEHHAAAQRGLGSRAGRPRRAGRLPRSGPSGGSAASRWSTCRAGLADHRNPAAPPRCRGRRRGAPGGPPGRRTGPRNASTSACRRQHHAVRTRVDEVGRCLEDADHPAASSRSRSGRR